LNDDPVLLQMTIGNAGYHCSCVNYLQQDNNIVFYVGLSVGLGVSLIIIIIIIIIVFVVLYRKNRKHPVPPEREATSTDEVDASTDNDYQDNPYSRHLPGNYVEDVYVVTFRRDV